MPTVIGLRFIFLNLPIYLQYRALGAFCKLLLQIFLRFCKLSFVIPKRFLTQYRTTNLLEKPIGSAWELVFFFTYPAGLSGPPPYLGLLGVVLAVFILWRWRRSLGRGPAAALAFSAISLIPVLGFLNFYPMRFSYVADHFQYIASLGLISLLGGGAARWWIKIGNHLHLWGKPAAAVLLAVLGALTWWQVRIYENEETLWRDTLRKNPESWMAHNNLGLVLAQQGKIHDAIRHYREALRIRPMHSNALNNLGSALFRLGRIDKAIEMHRRALDESPGNAFARSNLGRALVEKGLIKEGIKELELHSGCAPLSPGHIIIWV